MSFKNITHAITLTMILAASMTSTLVTAQESGERRGPPPEAMEACANLTVEAACSFSGPRGDVTGSCTAGPQDSETLACKPEGGKSEGRKPKKDNS